MTSHPDDATSLPDLPLAGRTVLVTAERRAAEQAAAFERRGARTLRAAPLAMVPHVDDALLLATTRELLADPPDTVVVTTGSGFVAWLEAAAAAGLRADLLALLGRVRVVARGPKGHGALVAAGIRPAWVTASEQNAEVAERLVAEGLAGRDVAVQHHGAGADGLDEACTAAGARVRSLVVHRWGPPSDTDALAASLRAVAAGEVDVVTFTAAPPVVAWLDAAEAAGLTPRVVELCASGALTFATVGPVTAAPLLARGLPALVPERFRLGAMVAQVCAHLAGPTAGLHLTRPGAKPGPPATPGPSGPPVLVGCSHGTANLEGRAAISSILDDVRRLRPGLDVREAFVDVQEPEVAGVVEGALADAGGAVVVPLLLSVGFHVKVDVAAAVARPGAAASGPLGPDALLVEILRDRLREAGLTDDDALVLAAAGSSDPAAAEAVAEVARGLAAALGREVGAPGTVGSGSAGGTSSGGTSSGGLLVGFGAGAEPRVPAAVARARASGRRVVVASYLLAPGYFHDRVLEAGADVVAAPLAPDPRLAELTLRRYDEARRALA